MTARPEPSCAILRCEGRQRPHDIDLKLLAALDRRPKIMVTVGILGERVGVYLDGLGEIERDAVAVRRQDAFSEREDRAVHDERRSEEHTSELQSLMRISYAVFCLKKKIK